MSYILSALRKADQDRKKREISDAFVVENIQSDNTAERDYVRFYWIGGGIVLLLAFNVWFIKDFQNEDVVGTNTDSGVTVSPRYQDNNNSLQTTPPSRSPIEFESKPIPQTQQPQTQQPETQRPETQHLDSNQQSAKLMIQQQLLLSGKVPTYDQLPSVFRDTLPTLQLNGHLFSLAHPKARKVIINGKSLREGDYIDTGLQIQEITVDGVVLDYQGTFFRLGAHQMFQ